MFVFVFVMHYFVSIEGEEKAGCFAFIVLEMYCYHKCSVALSHSAMGLVCSL